MINLLKSFKTVQLLIFFNLLLAVVAFVKDIQFAAYFGTTQVADSISLAFFLPDTLGNNLIGATIAVSSIPVLTRLTLKDDLLKYYETIVKLVVIVLLFTFTLFCLVLLFKEPLFSLFSVGNEGQARLLESYFWILTPIIVIAPLWLMGSSVLQSGRSFIVPAVMPIIFNILLLIGLLFCQWVGLTLDSGGLTYSKMITSSTLCVCGLTWFFIIRDHRSIWKINLKQFMKDLSEVKKIGSTFIAYLLILLFTQGALFFERMLASSLETGTVAALTYAYRISQFPIWVFIAAVNTFILPTISIHLENKAFQSLKRDLYKSFIFVIGVSLLISIVLVVYSDQIINLLLARGSFDKESVRLTSSILKSYSLSIVGQSLYIFCTRYYVAEGRMKKPCAIGFIGFTMNIILLYFFVPKLGAAGIGYAIAVSSSVSGIGLLISFIRDLLKVK